MDQFNQAPAPSQTEFTSAYSWHAGNEITGTSQMVIPDQTQAKELYLVARYGNSSGLQQLSFGFTIPNITNLTGLVFTQGYNECVCQLIVNTTTHRANIATFKIGGNDYSSTCKLYCFYR